MRVPSIPSFTCFAAFLALACNNGSPGASTTDATDSLTSTEATMSQPTSGGPSTDATSTTGSDTGEQDSRAICERYLACISVVAPGELPTAQMGFGSNGTCWEGSESDAQLCLDACMAGLEDFNEVFPEEKKCGLCQEHSECNMAAGELCHLGKCEVTTCGDGIVQADEICDSQPECKPSCQGPQPCNPMSGHGCQKLNSEVCFPRSNLQGGVIAECRDPFNPIVSEDAPCGGVDYCQLGLGCALTELYPACDAKGQAGCCAPYCDLGQPNPCTAGRSCVPYLDYTGHPLLPELGFLGVCVPA